MLDREFLPISSIVEECGMPYESFLQQKKDLSVVHPAASMVFEPGRPGVWRACREVQPMIRKAREIHLKLNYDADPEITPLIVQLGDHFEPAILGVLPVPIFMRFRKVSHLDSSFLVFSRGKMRREHYPQILWSFDFHSAMLGPTYKVQELDQPWEIKMNTAIWRGALHGRGSFSMRSTSEEKCMSLERCKLSLLYANSQKIDAGVTETFDKVPKVVNGIDITKPHAPMEEQLGHKMIIILPGNDVGTGLKWALYSNSVVLCPPLKHTTWAMEEMLQPWVHFVPIDPDLTDVEEQVQWVLENDEEAQRIAERSKLFIHDLLYHKEAKHDDDRVKAEILKRYFGHFKEYKDPDQEVGERKKIDCGW
eukprot:CAMPEP_0118678942 /NCGR_PEP_ID=MMETSP0800-20121206/3506_1 /TAXON_ID=210618 ORGANISM="Striatella unipunctata, Strain CCMP2910" /NCGR_SAMPLE_ID=MMETSP0800 /ASSEMBLY_ACC=CAM_ASM_000638 /LENGTH=364 /DNA_ID=CAMNT_0006574869 /DNA_START=370 /DNA_END=1461 /DNA_ORIENTATION=+